MADVTASIVVQFAPGTDDGSLQLIAEIDSRDDGYNAGSTDFKPGQTVYYLIYKSVLVNITEHVVSAGRIERVVVENIEKTESLIFAHQSSASVGYPIHNTYSTKWLGRTPSGTLVKVSDTEFQLRDASGAAVEDTGVLHVTYTTQHIVNRIVGVPAVLNGETSYSVVVSIVGETT